MARIFLARTTTDLGGERLVVVKQILPILSNSADFSKLLIDEAKLSAQLTHGNIAQVTDLGREEGSLYIAMEYVEGFDLRDLLRQCSRQRVPLPVEFSLLIVMETLRALDYAHKKKDEDGRPLGIVHRDVSPSNVLVSFDGEVKLCDFGIARAMGADDDVPDEAIQGKAGYMSPEAAAGEALDGRSDVFAVGIIAWELLAGRRLYKAEKGKAPSLELARRAEIPQLPERGLPDETTLHAIVMRALERDVDQRYASARDMQRELEAYIGGAGLVASPLRFGEWLMDHFGAQIVERRRDRERAARGIDDAGELPPSAAGLAPTATTGEGVSPVARSSQERGAIASAAQLGEPAAVSVVEPDVPPPSLAAMVSTVDESGRSTAPPEPASGGNRLVVVLVTVVLVGIAIAAVLLLR